MSTSDEDSGGFANVEVAEGDPQLTDEDFEAWGQSEDDDMPSAPAPAPVLPASTAAEQVLVSSSVQHDGDVSTDITILQDLNQSNTAAAGSPAPASFNTLTAGVFPADEPAQTNITAEAVAGLVITAAPPAVTESTASQVIHNPILPMAAVIAPAASKPPAVIEETPHSTSASSSLPLGTALLAAKAAPKKLGAKKVAAVKAPSAEAPPPSADPQAQAVPTPPAPPRPQATPAASLLPNHGLLSAPASSPTQEAEAGLTEHSPPLSYATSNTTANTSSNSLSVTPPPLESQPTHSAQPKASPYVSLPASATASLPTDASPSLVANPFSHSPRHPETLVSTNFHTQPHTPSQSPAPVVPLKLDAAQVLNAQAQQEEHSSHSSLNAVSLNPEAVQRREPVVDMPVPVYAQSMSVSSEIEEAQEVPPKQQVWGGDGRSDSGKSSGSTSSSVEPQSGVFGWPGGGGGWGLGGWGQAAARFKEAAVGAVRDVTELTETFKQALVDVAEDEEFPIAAADHAANRNQTSSYATASAAAAPPDPPRSAPSIPSETATGVSVDTRAGGKYVPRTTLPDAGDSTASGNVVGDSEERDSGLREQVLLRLQAAGDGGKDTSMEVGLKAIDDQVEQLANNAARAFSSLWGGLRNVGAAIASQAEGSSLQDAASRLAFKAEKGLESMGRAALGLLDAGEVPNQEQQQQPYAGDHTSYDGSHEEDQQPQHYDDFLYIYGGVQLSEEMSELSNDCARLCNKSRARLEPSQQELLDHTLAGLAPYFTDLLTTAALNPTPSSRRRTRDREGNTQPSATSPFLPVQSHISDLDSDDGSGADRLLAMYTPVQYLCEDSETRAQAFSEQLQATLAPQNLAPVLGGSRGGGDDGGGEAEGEEESSGAEVAAAVGAGSAEIQARVLNVMAAHSAKRVAEICTAQVQLLLNYGASVAAPARVGRPADDGILWPVDHFQQASLLQQETRRMLSDLHGVTTVYCTTVISFLDALHRHASPAVAQATTSTDVAKAADDAVGEAGSSSGLTGSGEMHTGVAPMDPRGLSDVEHQATVLLHALSAQGSSAMSRVQDGFKGLLYTVLLRSIVTEIA